MKSYRIDIEQDQETRWIDSDKSVEEIAESLTGFEGDFVICDLETGLEYSKTAVAS